MNIEIFLVGFLFYFIIVTNISSDRFGYITLNELEPDVKLKKIKGSPKDFKISVALIITEHIGIIALAIALFIAFNSYSIILALVWTVSRTGEGVIQIYYKKSYWGLLNIAEQYPGKTGAEKKALIEQGRSILDIKHSTFAFAQLLFSIGTLAYCIMFVTSGVVPAIIAWFGIVATVLYGSGNGIFLAGSNFKGVWYLGGLLILIFEIILGGWLLFFPH